MFTHFVNANAYAALTRSKENDSLSISNLFLTKSCVSSSPSGKCLISSLIVKTSERVVA